MASGYGLHGGQSRCFPFWQELLACYVVNTDTADENGKLKCKPALEDYYECLHHKKEAERVRRIQRAYRIKETAYDRKDLPRVDQVRSLGLLHHDEETKAVIESRHMVPVGDKVLAKAHEKK